ncbi:hypothetical protein U9M48_012962, partial [Paspalum notatum var. saurae]
ICPNMKSVDRPPLNPKRITIKSSQECFCVDIPCVAALRESANPSDEDDDDDFVPLTKKPNVPVPTKQLRSSPQLSHPDAPGLKKCVKKIVTKKKKVRASPRQRINIRCIPQDVLETIAIMNQRQTQAVARKGFSDILDMTLDAIGSRSHLCWLMDKLDPKDMTIRPGPGKELKITKETVRLILGVPCAGGAKPLGVDATAAADRLRSSLSLTKDEFTVAKLQDRLRFVLAPNNYDKYFHYDIWILHRHTSRVEYFTHCLQLQIYYLDHLHAAAAPQNKFDTPRIKYFYRNIIKALTRADKRKSWQGGEPFDHCDF